MQLDWTECRMQMDWAVGRHAVGLGRWQKCSQIGMLPELQLDFSGTRTEAGFGLDWFGGRNGAELSWYEN